MRDAAMRAAVFHGRLDLRVEDRPAPTDPGPADVLIDVDRASICGTDATEFAHGPIVVPIAHADANSHHSGPTILGHEFMGHVVAVGDQVRDLRVGDRVVSGAGISCGRCRWCLEGRTNLCAHYYTLGLHTHGGLAERVAAPAATCLAVPDSCDDDAAALAQPLAVAIHALSRPRLGSDATVVVHGVGGIGLFVLAAAAARGIRTIAVDVDPSRLQRAARLGAAETIDVRSDNPVDSILQATAGDGADAIIECTGIPGGPAIAAAATRRGGTIVVVGLQKSPVAVDLFDLTVREITMLTSMAHVVGADLPEALTLLSSTDISDIVVDRVVGLDGVAEGLQDLSRGQATGKIVIDPRRA